MAPKFEFNRRTFLKHAGASALAAGAAAGSGTPLGCAASATAAGANGKYDFDAPYSRIGTNSVKWDQAISNLKQPDLIAGMGIADLDFRAAPCITKALSARCAHENWGYLSMPPEYTDAIVAWNKRRYGLVIDPATVVLTTGVHPGIIAALKAFCPVGTRVLLNTPTYSGFYGDLRFCDLLPEDVLMSQTNGRYSIDFDEFERHISPATNAYILCNPQNPTGNVWSAEDLLKIGEICLKHRVVVLADEIHCDMVTAGKKYTPFASLPNKAVVDNSITFKAASKSFSLPGMKAAWFFSTNPELLAKTKKQNRADLSTLGMVANLAALQEGDDWLDQLVPYIEGNQELVASYVKSHMPLIKCVKPEGTYLSWMDMTAVAERIDAKQKAAAASTPERKVTPEQVIQAWFAEKAKVALNPGSSFGTGGENHMRVNLGTSRITLRRALESMVEALKELQPGT